MNRSDRSPVLFLHEEVLLLALKDDTGKPKAGLPYGYAVGGAIIAELLLSRRISIERLGPETVLQLLRPEPIGDPLLDESLKRMAAEAEPQTIQAWVSRFANTKRLKDRIAERLCERGILRLDERKFFGLFRSQNYPEVDHRAEAGIIARLREAIFSDTTDISDRTILLISLARPSGLLSFIFGEKDVKARRARLETLVSGELIGQALEEAIVAAVQVVLRVSTRVATGA